MSQQAIDCKCNCCLSVCTTCLDKRLQLSHQRALSDTAIWVLLSLCPQTSCDSASCAVLLQAAAGKQHIGCRATASATDKSLAKVTCCMTSGQKCCLRLKCACCSNLPHLLQVLRVGHRGQRHNHNHRHNAPSDSAAWQR